MTPVALRWHRYPTPREVTDAVVERLAERATRAIAARGEFHVVLSGGSTPREIYAAATSLDTHWRAWHIYFADERCLPRDHPERNDTMARGVWLDRVPIPPAQIHAIPAELGPEAGAAAYNEVLAPVGPFDLVLLGLGEDGHTASLFPGHPLGSAPDAPHAVGATDATQAAGAPHAPDAPSAPDGPSAPHALAVRDSPKPPPERISLSAARLSRAEAVYVVVLGSGKQAAVRRLSDGADVPLAAVQPQHGLDIFLDAAADAGRGEHQRDAGHRP